ncbi:Os02g0328600, partial [Oryza sativa Japonica Group]
KPLVCSLKNMWFSKSYHAPRCMSSYKPRVVILDVQCQANQATHS